MITTVLLGLAALFVYLQIGYWLGNLSWWSWHVNKRANRVLAFLLFPVSSISSVTDAKAKNEFLECHAVYFGKERREVYFSITAFFWPLLFVLWNSCIFACSGFVCAFLALYKASRIVSFPLIAGPKMLVMKIVEWVRARCGQETHTRVVAEIGDAPTDSLLTADDRTRAEEYRRLCKECDDLEGQLAPRKARRAEIEAEDAATHDAFRDLPQEMRLPKA